MGRAHPRVKTIEGEPIVSYRLFNANTLKPVLLSNCADLSVLWWEHALGPEGGSAEFLHTSPSLNPNYGSDEDVLVGAYVQILVDGVVQWTGTIMSYSVQDTPITGAEGASDWIVYHAQDLWAAVSDESILTDPKSGRAIGPYATSADVVTALKEPPAYVGAISQFSNPPPLLPTDDDGDLIVDIDPSVYTVPLSKQEEVRATENTIQGGPVNQVISELASWCEVDLIYCEPQDEKKPRGIIRGYNFDAPPVTIVKNPTKVDCGTGFKGKRSLDLDKLPQALSVDLAIDYGPVINDITLIGGYIVHPFTDILLPGWAPWEKLPIIGATGTAPGLNYEELAGWQATKLIANTRMGADAGENEKILKARESMMNTLKEADKETYQLYDQVNNTLGDFASSHPENSSVIGRVYMVNMRDGDILPYTLYPQSAGVFDYQSLFSLPYDNSSYAKIYQYMGNPYAEGFKSMRMLKDHLTSDRQNWMEVQTDYRFFRLEDWKKSPAYTGAVGAGGNTFNDYENWAVVVFQEPQYQYLYWSVDSTTPVIPIRYSLSTATAPAGSTVTGVVSVAWVPALLILSAAMKKGRRMARTGKRGKFPRMRHRYTYDEKWGQVRKDIIAGSQLFEKEQILANDGNGGVILRDQADEYANRYGKLNWRNAASEADKLRRKAEYNAMPNAQGSLVFDGLVPPLLPGTMVGPIVSNTGIQLHDNLGTYVSSVHCDVESKTSVASLQRVHV